MTPRLAGAGSGMRQQSEQRAGEGAATRRLGVLLMLLVGAAFVAVHGRTAAYPMVNWDDPLHVYRNPSVERPETQGAWQRWLPRALGYPMPLTIASYRLDRALALGDVPVLTARHGPPFHRTNLVLSLGLLLLAGALLLRLVPHPLWAALALGLFALHPLVVEPVAWVTGRKDLLAALFAVAAVLAWIRGLERGGWRGPALFVGCTLAALLSKPSSIYLPVFAGVIAVLWRRAGHRPPRGPLLVALGASLLVALGVGLWGVLWNRAAGGVELPTSAGALLSGAALSLGIQLKNLLWPLELAPRYLVGTPPWGAMHWLGLAGALAAALAAWRLRRLSLPVAAGLTLALLAYLPASNLVPLRRFVADSYLLVPLLGLALAAGAALCRLEARLSRPLRVLLRGGVGIYLVGLWLLSLGQVAIWSDSTALWSHQMRIDGRSPQVCRMLANAHAEAGELHRAEATYRACGARFGPELFDKNLAIVLFLQERYGEATQLLRRVLARSPDDPTAHRYLAEIRRRLGSVREQGPRR